MAVEIDTASGFIDLQNRLISFLTTNGDLVSADQNWSVAWEKSVPSPSPSPGPSPAADYEDEIVLEGPGLSEQDQIFVGMKRYPQPNIDVYNWGFRGVVGLNGSAESWDQHINLSGIRYISLGEFPMPYWFIANGRRFMGIVRVSGVYQFFYGGFILSYAPPNLHPYPLAIGGTGTTQTRRWSSTANGHSMYCDPAENNLVLFEPTNSWSQYMNWTNPSAEAFRDASSRTVAPWNPGRSGFLNLDSQFANIAYRRSFMARIQPAFGGDYPLTEATMCHRSLNSTYGVLQGVFHVPGFNLPAETVVSQGDKDYVCFPNIYREGNDRYSAYLLE